MRAAKIRSLVLVVIASSIVLSSGALASRLVPTPYAHYDPALELKPGDVPTPHMRARLHQELADLDELIRLDPRSGPYSSRAYIHLALVERSFEGSQL